MDRIQQAVKLFDEGFSCSQSVLAAFADMFDVDLQAALKIASGFGGGMGQMSETCGALTGAMMVLGLKYGTDNPTDKTAKLQNYRKVRELSAEFKLRAGSQTCRDLLGFDMSTADGQLAAKQPGAFHDCPDYVRIAAEIVQEMMEQ
ncbi:MAG: C-GCAxxG-C-C family protein [Planctomycetota bacterium]|jgi:C_GCAxxG_C_C family probable redox protein